MKVPIAVSGLLLGFAGPCPAAYAARAVALGSSSLPAAASPAPSVAVSPARLAPSAGLFAAAPALIAPAPRLAAPASVAAPALSGPTLAVTRLSVEMSEISRTAGNPGAAEAALERAFDGAGARAASAGIVDAARPERAHRPSLAKAAAARRQSGQVDPFVAGIVMTPVAAGALVGLRFGEAALLGVPGAAVLAFILGSAVLGRVLLAVEDRNHHRPRLRVLLRTGALSLWLLGLTSLGLTLGVYPLTVLAAVLGAAALGLIILALAA